MTSTSKERLLTGASGESRGTLTSGGTAPRPASEKSPSVISEPEPESVRIGTRILGEFASRDYYLLKRSIVLFPLRFISKADETKFFNQILQQFRTRANVSSITTIILFTVYWICIAICLGNDTFLCSGTTAEILFSVFMAIIILASSCPIIASSYDIFRPYLETSSYVIVILVSTDLAWCLLV